MERNDRGLQILSLANQCHQNLEAFRRERERNKRYTYGDQWSDIVNIDGRRITEEQYIMEQGSIPLKNNLIRRLVRNVIGIYDSQCDTPVCIARDPAEKDAAQTMNTLLQYNMEANRMSALLTRSIEEFLISGMVVHRKSYGQRCGRTDCWTDYVQPNNFFVDSHMRDFRGWDCTCVGEVHHVKAADVCRQLACDHHHCRSLMQRLGADTPEAMTTVTEVWRLEHRQGYRCHDRLKGTVYGIATDGYDDVQRTNRQRRQQGLPPIYTRWQMQPLWRYYFLSAQGDILAEGDSPYAHGSHPYVFKIYPMIDGEVHSFVADVIDQQRYTNRLITLYDWIMRASSKGVLLVPEDSIPAGCTPDDFADAWSRYNGVIFYKPSMQGAVPQQVANNSTNIGIRELLDVQLKFFEDISGVSHALQGKTGNTAISAELYGQQTQYATTTLLDLLDTFNEFVREGAYKDMNNIRQYYTAERVRGIAGAEADIERCRNIDFDLSLAQSTQTPAYRQSTNALLMEIWRSGQIDLEQMLRAGHFPFADTLLTMTGKTK